MKLIGIIWCKHCQAYWIFDLRRPYCVHCGIPKDDLASEHHVAVVLD